MALDMIEPMVIAAYVEKLLRTDDRNQSSTAPGRDPDAVRLWYRRSADCEPASAVRGPKYVTKKGKTPVLTPDEAPLLLNSISVSDNSGLRDRALLAVMVYSFARVSAASSR
jgi:integrase/recombinase XerD